MDRRYRVASLAATILLTTVGAPIAGTLGGDAVSAAVSLVGLVLTWSACVWCWGVARRPRLYRLVVTPMVQLPTAFFVGFVGAPALTPAYLGQEWAAFVASWLFLAGMFAFVSVLFAGFLRDAKFSGGTGGV